MHKVSHFAGHRSGVFGYGHLWRILI